jgi:multidrug resistance efflux pump
MAPRDVIRTPWSRRFRRIRYHVLPLASFVGCLVLTWWMWQRQGEQPNAVGEVEAVRIDVAAATDGLLIPLPNSQWTLFDRVKSGELLARLDDRPVSAQLETLRSELARLLKEVEAEEVRIALDHAGRERDHQQEAVRLTWQAERYRLEMLDRKTLVEADRIDLKRREAELDYLEQVGARAGLSGLEIQARRMRRDEAAARLAESEAALAEAEQLWKSAVKAIDDYPPLESVRVRSLLAPLEAAVAAQESLIGEVQLEIDSLEVRAPISGTICAINCWPGQHVRAGDPIVTLAADQGRYIVSYVRQQQRFRPRPGMPVAVRLRLPGARPVDTWVERVGPQVELVPPHHRRDPAVPEWGQPIRILPPQGLALRPGELVDVTFRAGLTEESG